MILTAEYLDLVTESRHALVRRRDSPAEFIIFNTKFLVFNTQFFVVNTQLLVLKTRFIIFDAHLRKQAGEQRRFAFFIIKYSRFISLKPLIHF